MDKKLFWYSGIIAVFVYIVGVVSGGILYPGYSHFSQDISQLTSTLSPIRDLMNFIFLIYNLLLVVFGIGIYTVSEHKLSNLGSKFIIIIGILGGVIWLFPINTRGTEITLVGLGHIVLVSIISLLTIVADFLFWFGFRKSDIRLARISLIAGILFLISGPIAAFNVMSQYAGLFERITISIFLLWILSFSGIMVSTSKMNR